MPWASWIAFCMESTYAVYSAACSVVISTVSTTSVFSGRSSMMAGSVLSLRRMNGAVSARRRSVFTSSLLFSIAVAKCVRKVFASPRMPGLQKSRMLRSSDRRFSTGVPVSATRCADFSERTALDTLVPEFLICCASSKVTRCQVTWDRSLWSRAMVP